MTRASSIRERNRAELTRAILVEGRRQLARDGAAALSLRSVAREVGMVSSAVYRYVANRDELLTLLIIDAYDALGAAMEKADTSVTRRDDVWRRWTAAGAALRSWAVAHPHQYQLIYGSPVPGYVAPPTTVPAASRSIAVLAGILRDCPPIALPDDPPPPVTVRPDLRALRESPLLDNPALPDTVLVRALIGWISLFGQVSFELGGQFTNVITDLEGWNAHCVAVIADQIGIPRRRRRTGR